MKILPLPKNQLQEVLYELMTNQSISVRQMMADTGILNIKARINNLRNIGLNIELEMIKVKNKYGRSAKFGQWHIPQDEKEKAQKLYLKLQNDQR